MICLVIFFIILIGLLTAGLLIKGKILLEFVRDGEDDHFLISLYILWGLINYKYEIPLIDLEKNGIKIEKFKEKRDVKKKEEKAGKEINLFNIYEKIKGIIRSKNENNDLICEIREYLRGKLVLENIRFDVDVGTGDAYYTGILSGIIWGAVGILTSYVLNNVKNIEKKISVNICFNDKKLNIDLHCIFSLRVVHIIVVRLKVMKIKKRSIRLKEKIGGGISG